MVGLNAVGFFILSQIAYDQFCCILSLVLSYELTVLELVIKKYWQELFLSHAYNQKVPPL